LAGTGCRQPRLTITDIAIINFYKGRENSSAFILISTHKNRLLKSDITQTTSSLLPI
jgi:hypothetical protein